MRYELWTYREPLQTADLTGFRVEATDGHIGKVDEATYDTGASYIVVDTGPWIFGKKVVLPAGTVTRVDMADQAVYVDSSKEEIKSSPEFDPDRYRTDAYRTQLDTYYGGARRSA